MPDIRLIQDQDFNDKILDKEAGESLISKAKKGPIAALFLATALHEFTRTFKLAAFPLLGALTLVGNVHSLAKNINNRKNRNASFFVNTGLTFVFTIAELTALIFGLITIPAALLIAAPIILTVMSGYGLFRSIGEFFYNGFKAIQLWNKNESFTAEYQEHVENLKKSVIGFFLNALMFAGALSTFIAPFVPAIGAFFGVTATLVIQIASASVLGVGFLGVINEFTETYLGFSFVKPFQKLGQYLKDKFKKDPNKKINRYEKLGPDFDYVPVEIEHESKDSKEEVTVGKVEVIDANSAYTDPKNHRFDSLMDTNLKDLQIKMQALHEQDLKSADEKKHTRKSHEFMLSLLQQEGARTAHLGSGHVKNKVLTELRTAIDKKPTEYLPNPAIIVSQIIENGDHSLVRVLNEIADRKDASLDSLTATIISNLTDQNVDFTLANFKMAVNIEAERIKFENSINPHAVKNILDKAAEEKDFSMQKLTTSRLKDTGGMQKTLVLANQYCSFFGDSKAEDSKHSDLSIELDDLRRQTL